MKTRINNSMGNKSILKPYTFLLVLLTSAVVCLASQHIFASESITTTTHSITNQVRNLNFILRKGTNEGGEIEISVEHSEVKKYVPNGSTIILYGRDLDLDGFADAWFSVNANGTVSTYERTSKTSDGWDVIEDLLENELKVKTHSATSLIFNAAISNLTFSGAHLEQSTQKLTQLQINILDLEIRADRIRLQNPRDPRLNQLYRTIGEGWQHISELAQTTEVRNQILWSIGDTIGLFVGGAAIRAFSMPAKWLAPRIAETRFAEMSETFYQKYLSGINSISEKTIQKAKQFSTNSSGAIAGSALKLSTPEKINLHLRGLTVQNKISRAAKKTVLTTARALKGGLNEAPYIGATTGLQLAVEIAIRKDTIFNANPITLGKNISNDKDLLQNLSFMSMETLIFASVSSVVPSLAKRMIICGVFAVANSSSMSYLIKGNTDSKRIALDAGWESTVGNAQVQIDLAALTYFQKLSQAQNNPKLKFLGYAVVLASSTVNYAGYGLSSKAYEATKTKEEFHVELLPLYAETI